MARRLPLFVKCVSVSFVLSALGVLAAPASEPQVRRFARFQHGETVSYGLVEGDLVRRIEGDLFGSWRPTGQTFALEDVQLLVPTQPTQVFALAGNYKSHLSGGGSTTTVTTVTKVVTDANGETTSESKTDIETRTAGEVPEKFRIPQPFFKSPSCLAPQGAAIVLPADAEEVHYEAELVVVIGRAARNVPKEKALDYVLGVTCGNDVSARVWQKNDVQWWRAKGCDTFGPCGPFIATGLNYDDLLVQLRLNGEVKQRERTSQLINGVAESVAFISRHVTLRPGDLIYTGTSGKTSALKPGDVVEVEIEGVGLLRNTVEAEQ